VASNPTAPLLTLAARTYDASGDSAAAERFLRWAIELDSTFLEAYNALGRLYITQRKLDAARAEFEAMAERTPKPVGALTMVGMILQTEGDVAGARARFERVLQIDPQAAVAANNLAWIYAANGGGDLNAALQLAKTAQRELPEDAVVADTLGFIYYKKDQALLAIPPLKLSTEKDPRNAIYWYHLGLAYASAGDANLATQSLSRALALKPDFDGAQHAKDLLSSLPPH
jgi:Flp pilus assembly protein TadD